MTEWPDSEELRDLRERLERVEAEVERLGAERDARSVRAPAAPPPPIPQPHDRPPEPVPPTRFERQQASQPDRRRSPAARTGDHPTRTERSPVVVVAIAGAAIFLAGAIFLLRFAIQEGWIGPELRFLFGLLAGGGLGAVAARYLLRGVPQLGTALLAAGLGTLEFTFYVGAFRYGFYGPTVGFAAAALGCVAAGALATRVRVAQAFLVTYLAAFLAPFFFSTGAHRPIELAALELTLFAAALLVAHVAPQARRWGFTRWAVAVSQGFLQLGVAAGARTRDEPVLFLLLLAFVVLAAVWIWRPVSAGRAAASPTLLWLSASLAAIAATALHWEELGWSRESFALPVLLLAAIQLALVRPARRGLAPAGGDVGLIVLAGALIAAAVPIALDWRWAGPLWGLLAVGTMLGSAHLRDRDGDAGAEARGLGITGLGLAVAATLRWALVSAERLVDPHGTSIPFLNEIFVTAVLVSVAWALLARSGAAERAAGFVALQGVANVALALEIAELVGWMGGGQRARLVAMTLVWASSGAVQWLAGLRHPHAELRRGLVGAGYLGLAAAAVKLVFVDLAQASMALRALVFLAAGGIFLGAALAAHRLEEPGPES